MKKCSFTICSNNYLGQAKVLTDSIKQLSPDFDLYIILCDKKKPSVNYMQLSANIIEVASIGIENFDWMVNNYDIVELNTAIKPFVFSYFFKKQYDIVLYFDPDIKCYQPLNVIEVELENQNLLLTPHSFAPLDLDGNIPDDTTFLNYGIYNLGFCGMKNTQESLTIIKWWSQILKEHCYNLPAIGLFVDQLPMNLAPLYFDKVKISKNKGLNVSWWNIHERGLDVIDGVFECNNGDKLCFFHFSNYKPLRPKEMTIPQRYSRGLIQEGTALCALYEDYYNSIIKANALFPKNTQCFYTKKTGTEWIRYKFKNKVSKFIFKLANMYLSI